MRATIWFLLGLVSALLLLVTSAKGEDAFDRVMLAAAKRQEWQSATTLSAKLMTIRKVALGFDVVGMPVSDRYLITRFGGPIDLVHFLALCSSTCGGRELAEALMEQWRSEGGPDFEAHRTRSYPTEAHPDDLPSNALGAVLGLELRSHNTEVSFDLQGALRRFFDSLSPFPDMVVKKYSHNQVVMGLQGGESKAVEQSRREWFTAWPLYLLGIIEPASVTQIPNASAALKRAGLEVFKIQGRPIGIRRVQAEKH